MWRSDQYQIISIIVADITEKEYLSSQQWIIIIYPKAITTKTERKRKIERKIKIKAKIAAKAYLKLANIQKAWR